MRKGWHGLTDERPWPPPLPPRNRLNLRGFGPTALDAPQEGSLTTIGILEHADLRYVPSPGSKASGLQTVRSLLTAKSPPDDAVERECQGLGAHGGNVLVRDCTVDADMPVSLDNGSLILIASDVRGFGHVSWAEVAIRRAALGGTRTALLSMFGGPLIVSARAAKRPSKVDEEHAATRAVADGLNSRRGTHYTAERPPGHGKGEQWEDGILCSPNRERIPVQVRHFSDKLAELLRGPRRSAINYDVGVLGKLLQSAIDDKTGVDADERRKAYLVLISPVALGAIKRTEIAALQLDSGGYADVWLYPSGEQAYSLIAG
jgi:hypothetical protein